MAPTFQLLRTMSKTTSKESVPTVTKPRPATSAAHTSDTIQSLAQAGRASFGPRLCTFIARRRFYRRMDTSADAA